MFHSSGMLKGRRSMLGLIDSYILYPESWIILKPMSIVFYCDCQDISNVYISKKKIIIEAFGKFI